MKRINLDVLKIKSSTLHIETFRELYSLYVSLCDQMDARAEDHGETLKSYTVIYGDVRKHESHTLYQKKVVMKVKKSL